MSFSANNGNVNNKDQLTLCLTPGDPEGIGPEITLKFLAQASNQLPDIRFKIVGSYKALEKASCLLNRPIPQTDQFEYLDVAGTLPGEISYQAIEQAVELILSGQAQGLVTGPIAKNHLVDAGIPASGHTEILEQLANCYYPHQRHQAEMLFVYRNFRLLLLTRHIPLAQVSAALRQMDSHKSLEILCRFLQNQVGLPIPKIALLGVNPHAGEIGGEEESQILVPLMKTFNQTKMADMEGPFPADAFFRGFDVNHPGYDAIVAMYHDQGLIPFKLLAGLKAVNVTIGLPFIRTSVGHGTGFDIAGQGVASEESLWEAVQVAIQLAKNQPVTTFS